MWTDAGQPAHELAQARLQCDEPVLPSSFAVATALSACVAAAGLAAAGLGHDRGGPLQQLQVDAVLLVAAGVGDGHRRLAVAGLVDDHDHQCHRQRQRQSPAAAAQAHQFNSPGVVGAPLSSRAQ